MRANRSPQRDGGALQKRLPVPTIRELDEDSDENLIPENCNLSEEFSVDNPKNVDFTYGCGGRDEGDGPFPSRRTPESPEPTGPNGVNTSPIKQSHSGSFERLIQSLLVRAQITVFLMDYTPLDFIPATGYDCRCPEIIEALIKVKKLDHAQARKAFAVWFTNSSDALEVQLKPIHNPFIIQKYWNYFLRRYADVSQVGKEAPIVYIRRSLWLTLDSEKKLTDSGVVLLLFEEARSNFLNKRYYLTRDDVLAVGCLLIYKDHGRYSTNPRHAATIRKKLSDYFPAGIIPSQRSIFQKNQREDVINEILTLYQGVSARNTEEIHLRLLLVCRNNPLYGAVFFSGVVEPPSKSRISEMFVGSADVKILIAINEKGLFILSAGYRKDQCSAEILLAFSHKEITFECEEPSENDALNDIDMACLAINIPVPLRSQGSQPSTETTHITRVLRVFSKQAPLMAACLGTFIHTLRAAEFCRRDNLIDGIEISETEMTSSEISPEMTSPKFSPEIFQTVKNPEISELNGGGGRFLTMKTAKSFAFPEITNRFDAFFFHSNHLNLMQKKIKKF